MSTFTKKEIRATFFRLLEQKPLSKITVKNLVETCDINRNTFYYYYKDIYDLIDDIFKIESDKVLSQNPLHGHWQDGCLQSMHYLQAHSAIIANVFNSIKPGTINNYLYGFTHDLLRTLCDNIAGERDIAEYDKEFVANFYSHAFVGAFMDWILGGMKQQPEEFISVMARMLNGSIYEVLRTPRPTDS